MTPASIRQSITRSIVLGSTPMFPNIARISASNDTPTSVISSMNMQTCSNVENGVTDPPDVTVNSWIRAFI